MKQSRNGFTLIEILVSIGILTVGLLGVVLLLRAGMHSTKNAIEDSNATIVAESVLASLQASLQRIQPVSTSPLEFFHDGIQINSIFTRPASSESLYIPGGIAASGNPTQFCVIGGGYDSTLSPAGTFPFNVTLANQDPGIVNQYSFNIELSLVTGSDELYNTVIRVRRRDRIVRVFRTQVIIPPALDGK